MRLLISLWIGTRADDRFQTYNYIKVQNTMKVKELNNDVEQLLFVVEENARRNKEINKHAGIFLH